MSTLSAAVAFFAGILTSFALEVVPGLREAWARQSSKRLILVAAHTIAPAVVWALACFIEFPFPFPVPCGRSGLLQVMSIGVTALAGNQSTYAIATQYLPRVQARNRRQVLESMPQSDDRTLTDSSTFVSEPSCDLCRLAAGYGGEITTRLWLYRYNDIIVVTDRDAKNFAMRALAVPVEHIPCAAANGEVVRRVARALNEARAIIESEYGLTLVKRDLHMHTLAGHYHAQDCYRRRDDGEPWK